MYNSLQLRELFHLEFLRWFAKNNSPLLYALKGGTNMRFFFNSFRYSEDMDLDIKGLSVHVVKDNVMKILNSTAFQDILKPFGIENIKTPDITKAKQTQTTQRFKIHLITPPGEDLFTKIEFSRRGFKGNVVVQPASASILRQYKLSPVLIPHYDIQSIAAQKVDALSERTIIQARDAFDLYVLSSQYEKSLTKNLKIEKTKFKKAYENLFEISFEQFRDTVVSYLSPEDRDMYNSRALWDEIQLKVAGFINELKTS